MKLFYSADYVAASDAFDRTRKSGWIVKSLRSKPIGGVEIVAPVPLTVDEICTVHDRQYVEAVRTGEPKNLAESQNFTWDPGLWTSVIASNGGVLSAARVALNERASGSLSSGLHHAQHGSGAAFCTFNGLAIAAKMILAEGARSVLILDLDAHCGGGTHWLIDGDDRIRQIDVSVNGVDGYAPSGANTLNIVRVAGDYLEVIESRLNELDIKPDLCIYNAGMDADERCEVGGLPGIDAAILKKREAIVFDWAKSRGVSIAFVLAGGYSGTTLSQDELVALHRLTIESACRITM
jgi:acetoin utilization deacetylase AcuC-like enzyme